MMVNFSFNTGFAFASALLSAAVMASDEPLLEEKNPFIPYKLRGVHSSTNVDDEGGMPSVPPVLEATDEGNPHVKDFEEGNPQGETLRNAVPDSNNSNKISFVFDPLAELGRPENTLVADHASADRSKEDFFVVDDEGYPLYSLFDGGYLQHDDYNASGMTASELKQYKEFEKLKGDSLPYPSYEGVEAANQEGSASQLKLGNELRILTNNYANPSSPDPSSKPSAGPSAGPSSLPSGVARGTHPRFLSVSCTDNENKIFKIDLDGKIKKNGSCSWLASKKKSKRKKYCRIKVGVNGKRKKLSAICKETCGLVGFGQCTPSNNPSLSPSISPSSALSISCTDNKSKIFEIDLNEEKKSVDCDWLASKKKTTKREYCRKKVETRRNPSKKFSAICKATCALVGVGRCASILPGPTSSPTPGPTSSPTPGPTPSPTPGPTPSPTPGPTPLPTPGPTRSPTPGPTPSPTFSPTPGPTQSPTFSPNVVLDDNKFTARWRGI